MAGVCALTWSEHPISFCFRQRVQKRFINLNQINRRGHVTLHYYALCLIAPQNSPRAHFKLHYYALCFAARLIGRSVRRRKFIAKPYSTVKPVLAEGWRLNLSAFPLKRAPHAKWNNEIERAELFLLFPLAFSEKGKFSFTALTIPPKLI